MSILMPFIYMSVGSLATIFTIGMMQAGSRSDINSENN